MIIPEWFLWLTGLSMLALGVLQIYARPHERGDSFYKRFINVGTLWSLCCVAVGGALLAMALGYWQGPLARRPPEPVPATRRHRR